MASSAKSGLAAQITAFEAFSCPIHRRFNDKTFLALENNLSLDVFVEGIRRYSIAIGTKGFN